YLDHPPLIAYVIRLGTTIFGDTPLGVRAGPLILLIGATWAVWRSGALLLRSETGGATAAVFFNVTLMSGTVGLAATPDSPAMAAAAFFVFCLAQVAETERPAWWLAAGVAGGVALSSKTQGQRRGALVALPVAAGSSLASLALALSRGGARARHVCPGDRVERGPRVDLLLLAIRPGRQPRLFAALPRRLRGRPGRPGNAVHPSPGARRRARHHRNRGETARADRARRRHAGAGGGLLRLAFAARARAGQLAVLSLPGLLHRRGVAGAGRRPRRARRPILASSRGPDGGAADAHRLRARVLAGRLSAGIARSGGAHSRRGLCPGRGRGRGLTPADWRQRRRHDELCPDRMARLLHALASSGRSADGARSMAPGAAAGARSDGWARALRHRELARSEGDGRRAVHPGHAAGTNLTAARRRGRRGLPGLS